MLYSLTPTRICVLIASSGVLTFAVAFSMSLGVQLGIISALTVSLAVATLLTWRQGRVLRHYQKAGDSMPIGVCMFDASERVQYAVSPDI
jgi:hypothetical protein